MSETEFAMAERLSLELHFLKKELEALREVEKAANYFVYEFHRVGISGKSINLLIDTLNTAEKVREK